VGGVSGDRQPQLAKLPIPRRNRVDRVQTRSLSLRLCGVLVSPCPAQTAPLFAQGTRVASMRYISTGCADPFVPLRWTRLALMALTVARIPALGPPLRQVRRFVLLQFPLATAAGDLLGRRRSNPGAPYRCASCGVVTDGAASATNGSRTARCQVACGPFRGIQIANGSHVACPLRRLPGDRLPAILSRALSL